MRWLKYYLAQENNNTLRYAEHLYIIIMLLWVLFVSFVWKGRGLQQKMKGKGFITTMTLKTVEGANKSNISCLFQMYSPHSSARQYYHPLHSHW